MKIVQTKIFGKIVKKLHENQKNDLDHAVKEIVRSPECGEQKKGDLAGVYIYKCKLAGQPYLIAYQYDLSTITLLVLGSHENFYRDIKK